MLDGEIHRLYPPVVALVDAVQQPRRTAWRAFEIGGQLHQKRREQIDTENFPHVAFFMDNIGQLLIGHGVDHHAPVEQDRFQRCADLIRRTQVADAFDLHVVHWELGEGGVHHRFHGLTGGVGKQIDKGSFVHAAFVPYLSCGKKEKGCGMHPAENRILSAKNR